VQSLNRRYFLNPLGEQHCHAAISGRLPTVRLAGDMRVPRVAVERLVAEATPKPSKEPEPTSASEPAEPIDVSKLSDEELARIAGTATPAPATPQRKLPPNLGGRPKGYPVSGAAKLAKERAQERREREKTGARDKVSSPKEP
jgi:hypothetical protein